MWLFYIRFARFTTDQKLIPFKNKRKKAPALSILRKEQIPETINPRKRSQGDSLMPPETIPHKISQRFQRAEDYEGDNDEKNCNTYGSRSENDEFVLKNFDK